jgi:hypothetical protein
MNARDYRKNAQLHMAKAAHLLAGQPGLSRTDRIARLQHATNHLASAMASAAGAVALEMASEQDDVKAGIDDVMAGFEALLSEPDHPASPDVI